ncbi:MAG: ATP-binding protein [Prevotella sp.]|nr:ATP-binding protein [Prevotella sp.]
MLRNPFVLNGYIGKEYFCDREHEVQKLLEHISNGVNVTLVSPRRVGKTGLIEHLFHQKEVEENYYTFLIDIYATKTIEEMVAQMAKSILSTLKSPQNSLDEIFRYIENADKPCIVAIDEFQTISEYPDVKAEALLRTYVQHCHNAQFIFAGSKRTMIVEMFSKHSRPFYQSTTIMSVPKLDIEKYRAFAVSHFEKGGKGLSSDVVDEVYDMFEGVTWYLQRVMNKLYMLTPTSETCDNHYIPNAIEDILDENQMAYEALLYQIPSRQKALLMAICAEGKASSITSTAFVRKHSLSSSSSVQSAIRGLLDKELVTSENGAYEVYDKFLAIWLNR